MYLIYLIASLNTVFWNSFFNTLDVPKDEFRVLCSVIVLIDSVECDVSVSDSDAEIVSFFYLITIIFEISR